jgi:hypothetical protein
MRQIGGLQPKMTSDEITFFEMLKIFFIWYKVGVFVQDALVQLT